MLYQELPDTEQRFIEEVVLHDVHSAALSNIGRHSMRWRTGEA